MSEGQPRRGPFTRLGIGVVDFLDRRKKNVETGNTVMERRVIPQLLEWADNFHRWNEKHFPNSTGTTEFSSDSSFRFFNRKIRIYDWAKDRKMKRKNPHRLRAKKE